MGNGCSFSPDFNFADCCNNHDDCWDKSRNFKEKTACDNAFRKCIFNKHMLFWGMKRWIFAVILYSILSLLYWGFVATFGCLRYYKIKKFG